MISTTYGSLQAKDSTKTRYQIEAKDVLLNINRTQAAERAKKCRFCPWWPWPLTFKLVHVRDQTCLPCEFGANPEIFHTQTKTTDWRHEKQNLPQFTACGN